MKLRDYFQIGFVTILAALLIKLFVLDAVIVSSPSMEGTLLVGDLVLVNKMVDTQGERRLPFLNSGFTLPHFPFVGRIDHGDVIVFKYPGDRDDHTSRETIEFVKRCVGLPGDTVTIRDGDLSINGFTAEFHRSRGRRSPLYPENFIDERLFPRGRKQNVDYYGPVIVPRAGDVVMLNNHTLPLYEKLISGEGHTVERSSNGILIDGKRTSTYTIARNYLFAMGDNFYESSDSRFWGFLPEENVIGKAMLVYWSRVPENIDVISGPKWRASLDAVRWNRIGDFIR